MHCHIDIGDMHSALKRMAAGPAEYSHEIGFAIAVKNPQLEDR